MTTYPRPSHIFPGYVLDLDGTVYLGDALLPGAKGTVEALRAAGSRVVFLSNKPLQTRADYAAKLTRLGVPTSPDEVINSSWVLARWLQDEAPGAALFVIGEQPLLAELRAAGFRLTEQPGEIQFVVASFDRTFNYRKLQIAFDAIRAGARLIATNADRYCPTPEGGLPDAAAVIGAIEGCTGKQVEVVVGKPSPITARAILARLQLPASECIIVGDRLETDIHMGREVGMATAVVLTGVTTPASLAASDIQPDYVLHSLDELLPP
ncbi:MAG: HAD family hydrolase [Chloroflexi bacterium]|nr:MAG: HAD family hydrolase [Chloroflexota bacterium]RLC92086.1 MAG: HAD family hydrolase [Chloroflexota bacterium]HEY68567.1 HAD-IIA family hydrolase [Thermoflexia bacterium]